MPGYRGVVVPGGVNCETALRSRPSVAGQRAFHRGQEVTLARRSRGRLRYFLIHLDTQATSPDHLRRRMARSFRCVMMSRSWSLVVALFVVVGLTGVPLLHAQTQSVTFQLLAPVAGEKIWQHVTMFANLTKSYEQQGQKISQSNQNLTSEQIRRIEILDTAEQRSARVRLTYDKATRTVAVPGRETQVGNQAVHEKTYVVWRTPETGGPPPDTLHVTYQDGTVPPAEELEIVRLNMQSVGTLNPLAEFLHGRRVQIGEELALPPELAAKLGWRQEYGSVERVGLRLDEVKTVDSVACGVFTTTMTGIPVAGERWGTSMKGTIFVEIATCRVVTIDMRANLHAKEERGPSGHTFTVSQRGQANIHSQSRFTLPLDHVGR